MLWYWEVYGVVVNSKTHCTWQFYPLDNYVSRSILNSVFLITTKMGFQLQRSFPYPSLWFLSWLDHHNNCKKYDTSFLARVKKKSSFNFGRIFVFIWIIHIIFFFRYPWWFEFAKVRWIFSKNKKDFFYFFDTLFYEICQRQSFHNLIRV